MTGPRHAVVARHPRRGLVRRVLSLGVLLIVMSVATAALVVPKLAGAIPLTVLSDSMAPSMPVGSLAVVRPTMENLTGARETLEPEQIDELNRIEDIEVGDVIVFAPRARDTMLVIHRVIGMSVSSSGQRTFTTQGDNNSGVDDLVAGHQVRAVLWYHLPALGYVNDSLDDGARRWIAVGAAVLGYAWAFTQFAGALRRRQTGGARTPDRAAGAASTDASPRGEEETDHRGPSFGGRR